jgi:hypothetical protein
MNNYHYITLVRTIKNGHDYGGRRRGEISVYYPSRGMTEYYRLARPTAIRRGCTLREFKQWLVFVNTFGTTVTGAYPYYRCDGSN